MNAIAGPRYATVASRERQAKALSARIQRFASDLQAVCAEVARSPSGKRMVRRLIAYMNYVTLEAARDLIHEARGLEAILVAARNTARRRRAARQRGAPAAGGFAKNPFGAGRSA
jgi:hypothetical protein